MTFRIRHRPALHPLVCAGISLVLFSTSLGCRAGGLPTIAVIPRTTGTALWEPERVGAEAAAARNRYRIYWNAPAREDDVEKQIALVQRADQRRVVGIVLSPCQSIALITPVRRAIAHGIPIVIVSSPLPIPGGGRLSYIVNDDELGGRLAARRVEELTHGSGSIAILGVNPDIMGIMTRARSLEIFLAKNDPGLRIVKKRGSFNTLHEQQIADETLDADSGISVIVALMWSSTRGVMAALQDRPQSRKVKVIGFDPDGALRFDPDGALRFASPALDSVVMQDTRTMGEEAVNSIALARRDGSPMPAVKKIPPTLVNRENVDTPAIRRLTSRDPTPYDWEESVRP